MIFLRENARPGESTYIKNGCGQSNVSVDSNGNSARVCSTTENEAHHQSETSNANHRHSLTHDSFTAGHEFLGGDETEIFFGLTKNASQTNDIKREADM